MAGVPQLSHFNHLKQELFSFPCETWIQTLLGRNQWDHLVNVGNAKVQEKDSIGVNTVTLNGVRIIL